MRYCRAMTAAMHPVPADGFTEELVQAALNAALDLPGRTPVFAVSGLQGSGKSTLVAQIAALAESHGLCCAVLSIDDFYLDQVQRAQLAAQVHPLLAQRGPPGTHDVILACEVLNALQQGQSVTLPRFDKLADNPRPLTDWPRIRNHADLVLLEGWFLKTPHEDEHTLQVPLNDLERNEDGSGIWRYWCNQALKCDYPVLWQSIDALWFLNPPSFEIIPQWRWQHEQTLHIAEPDKPSMNRNQVQRFVQLFERISRQALRHLPTRAQRSIRLDAQRNPLD